jgi:hypothetical protein
MDFSQLHPELLKAGPGSILLVLNPSKSDEQLSLKSWQHNASNL